MKKLLMKTVCIACALSLVGCLSTPEAFVASSIPVSQGQYAVLGEEVRGTSTQVTWLFFTFGVSGSVQRNALEDALDQVSGADGLTAMAIDSESFSVMPISLIPFPIFPRFYKVVVTGTPIKLNAQ